MHYADLRDFLVQLEGIGELKRVQTEVSPRLEMTEICDRVLRQGGPAMLFERPAGHSMPVLGNLFGTVRRVCLAMGVENSAALRELGKLLAYLREPEPPKGLRDAWEKLPLLKQVLNMQPREISSAPCQEIVWEGKDVDLSRLPVQTCWPEDAGPLITWGLTVTRGPEKARQNLGIYRQQVIAPNRIIMRGLAHRGGALDFRDFALAKPGEPFPIVVALGADPATILGAVTPVPDTLSEYQFAGLLRGSRTEVVDTFVGDAVVPTGLAINWAAPRSTKPPTMISTNNRPPSFAAAIAQAARTAADARLMRPTVRIRWTRPPFPIPARPSTHAATSKAMATSTTSHPGTGSTGPSRGLKSSVSPTTSSKSASRLNNVGTRTGPVLRSRGPTACRATQPGGDVAARGSGPLPLTLLGRVRSIQPPHRSWAPSAPDRRVVPSGCGGEGCPRRAQRCRQDHDAAYHRRGDQAKRRHGHVARPSWLAPSRRVGHGRRRRQARLRPPA